MDILYFFFYGFHSVENLIQEQFDDEKLTVFLKGNQEKNLKESDNKEDEVIKFDEKIEKPKTGLNPEISKDGKNETLSINQKSKGEANSKTESLDIQGSKNSKIDLKHSSHEQEIDVQISRKEDDYDDRPCEKEVIQLLYLFIINNS